MKCNDCGCELESPAEYHPHAFCVLVKAGYNPLTVVLDAVSQLTDLGGEAVGLGPVQEYVLTEEGRSVLAGIRMRAAGERWGKRQASDALVAVALDGDEELPFTDLEGDDDE